MKYTFHPEAKEEFLVAISYYEEIRRGLGFDFAVEVYAALQNILTFPSAWPILEENIRRCLTRRFPYGVLYTEEGNEIYVLAVMHLRRDPDYWKQRKS